MTRPLRLVAVVLAAAVAIGGVTTIVKASNGAFSGSYDLAGSFSSSGEGLHSGSEVTYRGVQVGRVTTIALERGRAVVHMAIQPGFRLPSDATATILPVNVFGADNVAFSFADGDRAPALAPGSKITRTAVSPELTDLFAAADPLLAQIDAHDLGTIVSNLGQGSAGEGPTIAASVDEGVKLADFLDNTLPQQLAALDSINGFAAAIAPTAASFNAIATASNRGLPAFNSQAANYQKLLETLSPFAENLAQFLAAYHPDIMTLLSSGDNVARVVLVQQQDVGQVLSGLAMYLTKFANAVDPAEVLPDGSHFGYFHTFVMLGDLNTLVCSLLAPAQPGLSFLAPLQQALSGAGSPLNCAAQIAAFDAAQASGAPSGSSTSQAATSLQTETYQGLGQPAAPQQTSLGGFIDSLLGVAA
jgi:phospholipid/cholesterol/gamma-HCH transport system substrate-binding protein